MMRHGKLLIAIAAIVLVLGILFVLGASVRAGWNAMTNSPDAIHLTNDYVFSGEQSGDLAVFARTIMFAADGDLDGDAALVGDTVQMHGHTTGDFSATASEITLGESARIDGDATLAGETVMVDGAIAGDIHISASKVLLGANSQLSSDVSICASAVTDQRANAAPVLPCAPALSAPPLMTAAGTSVSAWVLLAAVLAGGVLAALPYGLAPLRMARLDEGLRARSGPRLIFGAALFGLWIVLALLLALLPGGWVTQILMIVFFGATFVLGAPLMWLGAALAGLWIGAALARLVRRAHTPAPLAALVGGLLISGALALVGLNSVLGIVGLSVLAIIGLAAFGAARAAGAVGDGPRRTSYFVQG